MGKGAFEPESAGNPAEEHKEKQTQPDFFATFVNFRLRLVGR
jgi:hypothetical protein